MRAGLLGSTRVVIAALLAVGSLLIPAGARAHDVDVTSVARVFLDQVGARRYTLSVLDRQAPPILDWARVLPRGCVAAPPARSNAARATDDAGRVVEFECAEPLDFDDALAFPWRLAGVVVVARWSDGTSASAYFRGNGEGVRVGLGELRAGAPSLGRLAARYLRLGAEHILGGADHLLFVLGLLLLVRGGWPLVKTITAFTVAHSLTLAAAVLGYVPVDRAPVEAAIALSIVLLAREIVTSARGREHLVHRKPWLVAFAFGLLHGLGFAGALGALGLRDADVPPALLFFNLGVEAGQLAFVAVLLAGYWVLRRAVAEDRRSAVEGARPVLGYALGGLAMLWFIDRLPALWNAS
jgi:hypothetical protein